MRQMLDCRSKMLHSLDVLLSTAKYNPDEAAGFAQDVVCREGKAEKLQAEQLQVESMQPLFSLGALASR
jgi:hypothetical protein